MYGDSSFRPKPENGRDKIFSIQNLSRLIFVGVTNKLGYTKPSKNKPPIPFLYFQYPVRSFYLLNNF